MLGAQVCVMKLTLCLHQLRGGKQLQSSVSVKQDAFRHRAAVYATRIQAAAGINIRNKTSDHGVLVESHFKQKQQSWCGHLRFVFFKNCDRDTYWAYCGLSSLVHRLCNVSKSNLVWPSCTAVSCYLLADRYCLTCEVSYFNSNT